MLIAAFGLPGVMVAWGFAAVRTIAREMLLDFAVLETDACVVFERVNAERAAEHHLVVCSQYPEPALIDAVLAAGARPILFTDNLADCAAYLWATGDQPAMSIVRAVSTSAARLAPLRERPDVLVMRRDDLRNRQIDVLVAYMCGHIGLGFSDASLSRSAAHLGQSPDDCGRAPELETAVARIIDGYASLTSGAASLPPDVGHLVTSVLVPLDALFAFRALPTIVWPGAVFLQPSHLGEAPSGVVDLAGGARCLLYGPYLHLPAGSWAARATLSFGGDTHDQPFALEVVAAGNILKRIYFSAQRPGLFAASWTFAITQPDDALELRLTMESGAIEGSLALVEVALQHLDERPGGEVEEPQQVLRPKDRGRRR